MDRDSKKPICGLCGMSEMYVSPYAEVYCCPECGYLVSCSIVDAKESLKEGSENGAQTGTRKVDL